MTDGRAEWKNLKLIPDRKSSTRLNTTVLCVLILAPCGKGDHRANKWVRESGCSWDCNWIITRAERHTVHLNYGLRRLWGHYLMLSFLSQWITPSLSQESVKAKIISTPFCRATIWIDPLILLQNECQIFHHILRLSSKIVSFDIHYFQCWGVTGYM